MERRLQMAIALSAVLIAFHAPPATAGERLPPGVQLEAAGLQSRDYLSMGRWFGPPAPLQRCPEIAIDPPRGSRRRSTFLLGAT